jgi:plasmid stabilization system protein ParE
MPPIRYSKRANSNLLLIKNYLLYKFTQREVDNLYKLLRNFEAVIVKFPFLYPQNTNNQFIRRAVLSKQLSIFYKYADNEILVVTIIDNRMDYNKWP